MLITGLSKALVDLGSPRPSPRRFIAQGWGPRGSGWSCQGL